MARPNDPLPCPFCGTTPTLWKVPLGGETRYQVQCGECLAQQRAAPTPVIAITNWNDRFTPVERDPIDELNDIAEGNGK